MRAPVLTLRDATGDTVTTVEMTTLTTSSTRVFEIMLFNAGEVRDYSHKSTATARPLFAVRLPLSVN
jgi:hypothetical protein